MAKVVEPEAWHTGRAAGAGEGLPNSVAAHGLAIATDEHAVRPRPLAHVGYEDRHRVRWDSDGALASVGLGWRVESLTSFEQKVSQPCYTLAADNDAPFTISGVSSSRWLQFRLSLSVRWSRFWNRLMKEGSADQLSTVRTALGHFRRNHRDDGPDGR